MSGMLLACLTKVDELRPQSFTVLGTQLVGDTRP